MNSIQTYFKFQDCLVAIKGHVCDKSTQTLDKVITHSEELITDSKSWEPTFKGTENLVEQVKEAAENAMQQTGFVYEATSGMYYDYNTGYYYNAVSNVINLFISAISLAAALTLLIFKLGYGVR